MAARKKTTKKSALAKRNQNTAVALPSDLAAEFDLARKRDKATATQAGWQYISTKGSAPAMKVNDVKIGGDDNELVVAVAGANPVNMMYEGEFVDGQTNSLVCYAVANPDWPADEVESRMAPPAELATKISEKCQGCPMNAFNTDPKGGRGKACKNTLRLALLPYHDDANLAKTDGYMLSVPPVSLRNWTKFLTPITDGLSRSVSTVVTEIRKVPNEDRGGFQIVFDLASDYGRGGLIQDEDQLRGMLVRMKGDARVALTQDPMVGGDEAKTEGAKRPQQRRKKVTRTNRKKAPRKR